MELHVANALMGLLVGLTVLLPFMWTRIKPWWKRVFGKRQAQLDRIEAELSHNGGSSIKDVIEQIQDEVEKLNAMNMAFLGTRDEAIFITDVVGDCKWTSPALQRLTGRTAQELQGRGWINVFPQKDRVIVENAWYTDAVEHNRNFEYITRITTSPLLENIDITVDVQITAIKMRDSGGNLRGYFAVWKLID